MGYGYDLSSYMISKILQLTFEVNLNVENGLYKPSHIEFLAYCRHPNQPLRWVMK